MHLMNFQVLAASDIDCEDERIPGENAVKGGPGGSRRIGHMGSVSGADDAVYYEYKKSSGSNANKHPLFKKFRY